MSRYISLACYVQPFGEGREVAGGATVTPTPHVGIDSAADGEADSLRATIKGLPVIESHIPENMAAIPCCMRAIALRTRKNNP